MSGALALALMYASCLTGIFLAPRPGGLLPSSGEVDIKLTPVTLGASSVSMPTLVPLATLRDADTEERSVAGVYERVAPAVVHIRVVQHRYRSSGSGSVWDDKGHIARPGASPVAILPAESKTGSKVMSINLLLKREDQAVIWRGPLIGGAIQQFWGDVLWGELDYLVVDLPDTLDALLTVMQSLPLSGVVLVTSPQSLAGMEVRKVAQIGQQLNIRTLGLMENMNQASFINCVSCRFVQFTASFKFHKNLHSK